MTYLEFYTSVSTLNERFLNCDLKTYLRSLLKEISTIESTDLDADNVLSLLESAFTSSGFEQDEMGLEKETSENSKLFVLNVLKTAINDLESISIEELTSIDEGFGITLKNGKMWINLDPFSFLECGASWLIDGAVDLNETVKMDWEILGEMIEMGSCYE